MYQRWRCHIYPLGRQEVIHVWRHDALRNVSERHWLRVARGNGDTGLIEDLRPSKCHISPAAHHL